MATPPRRQSTSDADAEHKHPTPLINTKGLGSMTALLCEPAERLQLVGRASRQPGVGSHDEAKSADLRALFWADQWVMWKRGVVGPV